MDVDWCFRWEESAKYGSFGEDGSGGGWGLDEKWVFWFLCVIVGIGEDRL